MMKHVYLLIFFFFVFAPSYSQNKDFKTRFEIYAVNFNGLRIARLSKKSVKRIGLYIKTRVIKSSVNMIDTLKLEKETDNRYINGGYDYRIFMIYHCNNKSKKIKIYSNLRIVIDNIIYKPNKNFIRMICSYLPDSYCPNFYLKEK